MFFSKFNTTNYNYKELTNITNSVVAKFTPALNTSLFYYHTVVDGETPETLSYRFYNDARYHWIIILLNAIVDPHFDWALDALRFDAFMKMKYGSGNEDKVNHFWNINTDRRVDEVEHQEYVDAQGDVIGNLPVHISPISNREYEQVKNDEKRNIRILNPKYLYNFVDQFERLMDRDLLES